MTLGKIIFKEYAPTRKEFILFKKMSRLLMKKLKKGEINNLSYDEEDQLDQDGEIVGLWTTDLNYKKVAIKEEMVGVTFYTN